MGYTVANLTDTKNFVIANGVALLLTLIVARSRFRSTILRKSSP